MTPEMRLDSRQQVLYPDTEDDPVPDSRFNGERMERSRRALRQLLRRRQQAVYVDIDCFVYPVEGHPEISLAPDLFAAPGCDPGPRAVFKYWDEAGPIAWAVEFLLRQRNEKLGSPAVARKLDVYLQHLRTREILLYEPRDAGFGGFRCRFLRLDDGAGKYCEVKAGTGGWYHSAVLDLDFRPVCEGIEFRDRGTGECFAPEADDAIVARAEREAERAEREAKRAEREAKRAEREARLRRELEQRLRRLEQERETPS